MRFWPYNDMNFWATDNSDNILNIKWSHDCFKDYKKLSFDYYHCGLETLQEVINSGHNNVKSDMWFLAGIFLIRQSIELGIKALICRVYENKRNIQDIFVNCCHDLSMLFQDYYDTRRENYLTDQELEWLKKYLLSLEEVDAKSDMFRFPFEDEFLAKYKDEFLSNVEVANNLLQAFDLVYKCIQNGDIKENCFNADLEPQFFVFTYHGFGNCYLHQSVSDEGFHVKITGYNNVIDFIYQNQEIKNETKIYPLIFMFRNTIELCLKRLFYSRVRNGVPARIFYSKRRSHLIKKDLWKNVKPVIVEYAKKTGDNLETVAIVEKALCELSAIDKNGDQFRYPTSYSLEYKVDDKNIDIDNVYKFLKSIVNFLDACDAMLDHIADCEAEMGTNMDW